MRPSRQQLTVLGIALLGIAMRLVLSVPDLAVSLGIPSLYLYLTVVELVFLGLGFGYAYRLGRTDAAGTPLTVAGQFLSAAVVAVLVNLLAQVVFHDVTLTELVGQAPALFSFTVDFCAPFVFAGLAGVPLGAMMDEDDHPATPEPDVGTGSGSGLEKLRPSRPQLVVLGVALLGVGLRMVTPLSFFHPFDGVAVHFLVITLSELALLGLGFGYAYLLGRSGRAGSPPTVARQFLVASLVPLVTLYVVQFFVFDGALGDVGQQLAAMFSFGVDYVVPFVLAGLAGVPLGAMYGRDDAEEADAGGDGAATESL